MFIAEIAEQAIPFALKLNGNFRSTQTRTGVLISGPSGWGEFAPFPEYGDEVCAKWLAGALESAFGTFPAKLRSSVPVNSIIPILNVEQTISAVEAAVNVHGMTTFKIKVADSTPDSLASDELQVKAVRTSDGTLFDTADQAEKHEAFLTPHGDDFHVIRVRIPFTFTSS